MLSPENIPENCCFKENKPYISAIVVNDKVVAFGTVLKVAEVERLLKG